ncbi:MULTISPECIES: TraB/GumN family protein [unclassified Herbaspirillum]|uniref:TraB/GumN family protein n=1 Tax=unclassified Herbaspirillum TaxID=2624150 RepID=UPI000E2F2778|nr:MULTISPECIES: TraB/GumN family protein [unclassified Herbaspirillum]RFB69911.1 TraB/GumN family protein [Herbaspirillum sp. 3R-3a1]TFI07024.1 TraB/GumN family protein [Herbaspirillum sp. 3R11]TFI12962.1 TraB/GumN family protein [Herbaspirillum sp. 3R-11]TFI19203.1 TraB/GumN family protein [Herbaspirillum sp. 3C11]
MYFELTGTNVRILGSLHVFPKAFPHWPRWAVDAAAWAEHIILELDGQQVGGTFNVPPELACQALLPADTWHRLSVCWPNAYPSLHEMPPWRAAALLSTLNREESPTGGLEHGYTRWAEENHIDVAYLETATEFRDALSSIPLPDVEALMLDALTNLGRNNDKLLRLYQDWKGRKLEVMFRRAQKELLCSMPSTRDALFGRRNSAWLPKIEAACKSERRTLVAVGALHLCGPGNVLELLGRPYSTVK